MPTNRAPHFAGFKMWNNIRTLLLLAICACLLLESVWFSKYIPYFNTNSFNKLRINISEQFETVLIEEKFQRITNDSYAYTAYVHRSDRDRLVITGATNRRKPLKNFVCKITYRKSDRSTVVAEEHGHLVIIPQELRKRYASCLFICKITPHTGVPIRVSIKSRGKDTLQNDVEVAIPQTGNRSITVCLQPFHRHPSPHRLVEWFEFLQILAADRVIVYIDSKVIRGVSKVLQVYKRKGFVQIVPFPLPRRLRGNLHQNGQQIALNDCLYRNKQNTKYITSCDYDEYLIPKEGSYNWTSLLNNFTQKNACEYRVRTSLVPVIKEYQEQFQVQNDSRAERFKLVTMLNVARDPYVFLPGYRTKYFVLSECAEVIGVHHTYIFAGNLTRNKVYVFLPSEALGYHFRFSYIFGKPRSVVHDTYLLKYREELVKNVNRTWSEI